VRRPGVRTLPVVTYAPAESDQQIGSCATWSSEIKGWRLELSRPQR
jgi:hypothetical protein